MRGERYQIALILLGIAATALFGVFFYRELFPEYRIYQNDYVALEQFRSTYSGEPPPAFKEGVKQIVFEREDKGPPVIDRCTSCHVALQLPHFSPTKIALDINGNIVRNVAGVPELVPNEEYVWKKLDEKIAYLTDDQVNEQLQAENEAGKVAARLNEANELRQLKTAHVGEHVYDVTKVLAMHPLIGKETRPFEFHPVDEYGCTSCHSGNGKGLTTEKAHGPVFDHQYETEFTGYEPEFLERDSANDPEFSRVFNDKPAEALLFQTSPILVGHLIQAKCVQCHAQSQTALQGLADSAATMTSKKTKQINAIVEGYNDEISALLSLYGLETIVRKKGVQGAKLELQNKLKDLSLSQKITTELMGQIDFLINDKAAWAHLKGLKAKNLALKAINEKLKSMLGSSELVSGLGSNLTSTREIDEETVKQFLQKKNQQKEATGSLFAKWEAVNLEKALLRHVEDTQDSFTKAALDERTISSMTSDIDALTRDYHRGQQLYLSQACYACHKIAGYTRGGVGPELTHAAGLYPWYMKEKISWPQGTLKTSTMPNMILDHAEVEDLMTFLLAQNGRAKSVSETDYKIAVQEWEAGKKLPWEKPITPTQMDDLDYAMTVFATEGCAACHRLKGYQSNVGYRIERDAKEKPSFDLLYKEREWFQELFPEVITGSQLVNTIEKNVKEIDERIVEGIRTHSLLEKIEEQQPESIESLYSEFRYASRAKNAEYEKAVAHAKNENEKIGALRNLDQWKARIHRILMMYVQEYGLGRLIGPRPNWSGVYRSDEWLLGHFKNPSAYVPNSIMPILPFDETKFYALTRMLDLLGVRNRNNVNEIWKNQGFDPSLAYGIYCAQCHGEYLQGNGPVAQWIYPIPKNLRNAEFLRNLTKEKAIQSIIHGVKGTPMPPWGETPKDKMNYDGIPVLSKEEISLLVDWMFSALPGGRVIQGSQDVQKWNYEPEDVIRELQLEGNELKGVPRAHLLQQQKEDETQTLAITRLNPSHSIDQELLSLPRGDGYYASLRPKVYVGSNHAKEPVSGEIFDVVQSPELSDGEKGYYIKKEFYTEQNLKSGKLFFENNCAVCHGRDADGAGNRASVMIDAKPRMLINLDWLNSRDDLRLLRSIKYGVAGTSMSPWGDQTSSLQRLQLVMYIRSLSRENEMREELTETLYRVYSPSLESIEDARLKNYPSLEDAKNQLDKIAKERQAALEAIAQRSDNAQARLLELIQDEQNFSAKLKASNLKDQQLLELVEMVKEEEKIFKEIGTDLLRAGVSRADFTKLNDLIALNSKSLLYSGGQLSFAKGKADQEKKAANLATQMIAEFDAAISALEKQKIAVSGKISLNERAIELNDLNAKINTFRNLKQKLLRGFDEISLLKQREEEILKQLYQSSILDPDSKKENKKAEESHI